jgi:transglutaminase-like putative cysteine protease
MQSPATLRIGLIFLALVNMLPAALPRVGAEDAWGLLAIAVSAAVISCLLYRPSGRRRVPHWVINLLVLAALVHLGYEILAPHAERTVYLLDVAHFLMLLCSCKFFELHTNRDVGLTFLILFLLLAIAAMVSASVLFGVAIAVDLTLGLGWLLAFQRQCEMDLVIGRRPAVLAAASSPGPLLEPEPGRGSHRGSIIATAWCSSGLIAIATVAFIAAPRGWGRQVFGGIYGIMPDAVTGLSEEVRLDDAAVSEDTALVMRVRFFKGGQPITREDFLPYMRGRTFDRYYEGHWRRTPTVSQYIFDAGTLERPVPIIPAFRRFSDDQLIEQRIWLDDVGSKVLFSMYPPATFGSSDIPGFQQDRRDLALQALQRLESRVQYTVHSVSQPPPELALRLEVSPQAPRDGPSSISPRLRSFAETFTAGIDDPTDPQQQQLIAQRVCDHLRSGEFQHTLRRGASAGDLDPLEDFLFLNKRGHCEYFASAMTLLCQAVGIRARLVGGYYGGQFNPVGGFYQFRRTDAHAWVEVYLPHRGWITFDPSPPSDSPRTRRYADLLARAQGFIDYLEFTWATQVISFDAQARARLLRGFTNWLAEIQSGFQTGPDPPGSLPRTVLAVLWGPELLPLWQRVFYWLLLLLCLALVVLTLRVFWILSLMLREVFSTSRPAGTRLVRRPEAKFYDRLLLLLSSKGHVKPQQLTPREFARRLAGAHRAFAELPEYTAWFYRAQYGRRGLEQQQAERLRVFLQRLREDASFGLR